MLSWYSSLTFTQEVEQVNARNLNAIKTRSKHIMMVAFSGGSNPVKGDFLVLAGATLYAVSNTTEVSKSTTNKMLLYRAKM